MSFGGSFGGELSPRAQIMLSIGAEGLDVPSRATQEIEKLKVALAAATNEMAANTMGAKQWAGIWQQMTAEIQRWVKVRQDAANAGDAAARQEIREAEEFAKVAIQHEQVMAKMEADAERAMQKEVAAYLKASAAAKAHTDAVHAASIQVNAALDAEASGVTRTMMQEAEEMARFAARHEQVMGESGKQWFKNISYGALALGYTFQDLTSQAGDWERGIAATLNNIPQLAISAAGMMKLSTEAAMGWAGGLTIAASAVMVLYRNWGSLEDALGMSRVKDEADRMEELGRKTHKTAQETAEYNKLKREQAGIEQMLADRSKEQKKTEELVQSAYAEAGPEKVKAAIKGLTGPEDLLTDREKARLAGMRQEYGEFIQAGAGRGMTADSPGVKARREEIEAEEARLREVSLGRFMAQAKTDPAVLGRLVEMTGKAAPGVFPSGFAGDIAAATPEARKQQDLFEAQGRANADRITEESRENRRREREQKEEAKRDEREADRREKKALTSEWEDLRDRARGQTEMDTEYGRNVGKFAGQYGAEFGKRQGPGSFGEAVTSRIARGQDEATVRAGLRGQVEARVGAGGVVPPGMVADVARQVIDDAMDRIRQQAAARGVDVAAGAGDVLGDMIDKQNRQQQAAEHRQQADVQGKLRKAQQMNQAGMVRGMAEDIYAAGGGEIPPGMAMAEAPAAVRQMQRTGDQMGAVMGAVARGWHQMQAEQQRQHQMLMQMQGHFMDMQSRMQNQVDQRAPLVAPIPFHG